MALSSRLDQDALNRILRRQLDVLTREQAVTAGVTRHALDHRLRSGGPWRRLPALFREALTDIADGIRSSTEADLKDLLTRSRLPRPLYNPMVFAGEDFIASPDAWWPDLGVAVEVDSVEWHLSPADFAETLARGRRMAIRQLNVLRFTPKQLRTEPAHVVAEIRAALKAARDRPPPVLRTISSASDPAELVRLGM